MNYPNLQLTGHDSRLFFYLLQEKHKDSDWKRQLETLNEILSSLENRSSAASNSKLRVS
jgi:hypothetical protein